MIGLILKYVKINYEIIVDNFGGATTALLQRNRGKHLLPLYLQTPLPYLQSACTAAFWLKMASRPATSGSTSDKSIVNFASRVTLARIRSS